MSEDRKTDILERASKGKDDAENVPAQLFRQMLYDLNINSFRWGHLLRRFVSDPRNNVPQTRTDMNHFRGNLNKELKKPRITFPTLVRGIRLLNPIAVTFKVELEWRDKSITVHSVRQQLNRMPLPDEEVVEGHSSPEDRRFDY